jgi:dihydroorotate dehydrogenase
VKVCNPKTNRNGRFVWKPLTHRSTEVIWFYRAKKKSSCSSTHWSRRIHSAEDAIEKLDAEQSLIQLYTGFIYEGPAW